MQVPVRACGAVAVGDVDERETAAEVVVRGQATHRGLSKPRNRGAGRRMDDDVLLSGQGGSICCGFWVTCLRGKGGMQERWEENGVNWETSIIGQEGCYGRIQMRFKILKTETREGWCRDETIQGTL